MSEPAIIPTDDDEEDEAMLRIIHTPLTDAERQTIRDYARLIADRIEPSAAEAANYLRAAANALEKT